jgi:hypothetical protein
VKTRELKRREAADRTAYYESLPLDQKIQIIKGRRGESKKELARLMKQKEQK